MSGGFTVNGSFTFGMPIYREHGQGVTPLDGVGGTNDGDDDCCQEFASTFESLVDDMKLVLHSYSLARFDDVAKLLNEEGYKDRLSVNLVNTRQNTLGCEFKEKLRKMFTTTFEGLQQSVIQYSKLVETIQKLEECQKHADILKDPDKLKEYIANLNNRKGMQLFEIPDVTSIAAVLKPEFQLYLERYGIPEGYIFDTDLLTEIRQELGMI